MLTIDELREKLGDPTMMAPTVEAEVENAIDVFLDAKELIEAVKKIQNDAKQVIADVIEETGQMNWNTNVGRATITKPSKSVRWNTKQIDQLMADDGLIRSKLAPFRTESERAGTMRITAPK